MLFGFSESLVVSATAAGAATGAAAVGSVVSSLTTLPLASGAGAGAAAASGSAAGASGAGAAASGSDFTSSSFFPCLSFFCQNFNRAKNPFFFSCKQKCEKVEIIYKYAGVHFGLKKSNVALYASSADWGRQWCLKSKMYSAMVSQKRYRIFTDVRLEFYYQTLLTIYRLFLGGCCRRRRFDIRRRFLGRRRFGFCRRCSRRLSGRRGCRLSGGGRGSGGRYSGVRGGRFLPFSFSCRLTGRCW